MDLVTQSPFLYGISHSEAGPLIKRSDHIDLRISVKHLQSSLFRLLGGRVDVDRIHDHRPVILRHCITESCLSRLSVLRVFVKIDDSDIHLQILTGKRSLSSKTARLIIVGSDIALHRPAVHLTVYGNDLHSLCRRLINSLCIRFEIYGRKNDRIHAPVDHALDHSVLGSIVLLRQWSFEYQIQIILGARRIRPCPDSFPEGGFS